MSTQQSTRIVRRRVVALASIALATSTVALMRVAAGVPNGTHDVRQNDSVSVIHAQTMLDGRGGTQHNVWVVVRGSRVERVSATVVKVPGATAIELGTATLLPGLIDAHVHPGWYVDRQAWSVRE